VLECVVNVSEGRDRAVVDALAEAAGMSLLDVHSDPDHHRSVLTLAGPDVEPAVRELARRVVATLDLGGHQGVHPRLGVLDVVPFVPLGPDGNAQRDPDLAPALTARDGFATWAGTELGLPCFLYGPERPLPEVRRRAWRDLEPDTGPARPHATAGACAVGARGVLVAYNVWLDSPDVESARAVAAAVRSPALRALGLLAGGATQVSCNLVDPWRLGPADAYDAVAEVAGAKDIRVTRGELVGLAPSEVVRAVPRRRWSILDLDEDRTLEARLSRAGSR